MKIKITSLVVLVVFFFLGFSINDDRTPRVQSDRVNPYSVAGPQLDNPVSSLSESFEGGTFPPAGWTKLNPDGGTGWDRQLAGVSPIPGWNGGTTSVPTGGGTAAAFCTWNTGGATSNDQWLVSPQITNVQPDDSLRFWLLKPGYTSASYLDNIDILISTTTPTVGAFTTTVELLSFPAATGDTAWTQYEYRLGDYVSAGSDIYIAWREHVADNFNDGAAFLLDLVEVTESGGGGGPEPQLSLNHTPGMFEMGIFNNGSVGKESQSPFSGPGIKWDGGDGCFTGGVIYGTQSDASCNGNIGSFNVVDMANVESNFAGGFTSNSDFNQITTAIITDSNAVAPYGINVIQKSYTDTTEEYGFVRYGFINSTASPIADFYAGLFMDWDIGSATANSGGYAMDRRLVYNFDTGPGLNYYGLAALDGVSGMRTTTAGSTAGARTEAFNNISVNYTDSTLGAPGDFRTWIGTFVGTIAPGDTAWTTFAVVTGPDLDAIRNTTEQAQNKALALGWISTVSIDPVSTIIPDAFSLSQNYPNPFNPTTKISFDIPKQGFVTLKVYDVLGKEVATLVNDVTKSGSYEVSFDASKFASGVYFYTLQTDGFVQTKRMMLIK